MGQVCETGISAARIKSTHVPRVTGPHLTPSIWNESLLCYRREGTFLIEMSHLQKIRVIGIIT